MYLKSSGTLGRRDFLYLAKTYLKGSRVIRAQVPVFHILSSPLTCADPVDSK